MIQVDSTQREARAREVRHDAVATLTMALNGIFHFETETGKGTTLYIRLPVSDAAAITRSNNQQAAA